MKITETSRGSFDVVDATGKVLINFPTRSEAQAWIDRDTPQPLHMLTAARLRALSARLGAK